MVLLHTSGTLYPMSTLSSDTTPVETFGVRLRRFRLARDLSLNQLAASARVSKGYLSSIETGYNRVGRRPSGATLYALAEALDVSVPDLLGRDPSAADGLEIPPSLRTYAARDGVPGIEVNMLASIRFAGTPPCTVDRWSFLHAAIRASEMLDRQ